MDSEESGPIPAGRCGVVRYERGRAFEGSAAWGVGAVVGKRLGGARLVESSGLRRSHDDVDDDESEKGSHEDKCACSHAMVLPSVRSSGVVPGRAWREHTPSLVA